MFIPFIKSRKERKESEDPRLSVEERYKTHEKYVEAVKEAPRPWLQKAFFFRRMLLSKKERLSLVMC
jgi:hypothetical protein